MEDIKQSEKDAFGSPISRRSRTTESRAFESRVPSQRSPIVFGTASRFNVPAEVMKDDPDHKYGFVVYSSGNVEQRENFYEAMDRGWKPVPAAEHPSLARNYELSPFGNREEGDQLIRRGGQILMKRPLDIHEAEEEHYDSEKKRQQYMSDMYKQVILVILSHLWMKELEE